jgi:hypothetical protein
MQPYQQRVLEEKDQLDTRLRALADYLLSEHFKALLKLSQDQLHLQFLAMKQYQLILAQRIENF